jgi:hypothetical protein
VGCTAALTAWFLASAGRNLENFRPVSNDEGELLEVSYTLATTGALASPMYTGFFNTEDHHLWTLPLQHVLDAAAFKAFGAGIAQARWVSLVAAVATLWTLGWLALRWYGLAAALLTEVLMVFWRSDVTVGITGLPLLDVARVARYDVLAIAFGWLAIAAVDLAIVRNSRRRPATAGFLAGLGGFLAGLATLTQFFGLFALPVVLLGARRKAAVGGGAALALAPWLAFVGWHHADLAGQLSVYGQRGDFLNPTFYTHNITTEPTRYADVLAQRMPDDVAGASALAFQLSLLLLLALIPAVLWRIWRYRRCPNRADRLLPLSLASSAGLLLVVDQTKTPLYAIVLVPPACLVLAAGWSDLLRWVWQQRRFWLTLLTSAATFLLLLGVTSDGLRAFGVDRAESAQVTPYASVGRQIEGALPADGVVLGPERWWWALHNHPYISLRSLWFQWQSRDGEASFADLIERWQPRGVIVNNNVRDDIKAFPTALQEQFWTYIQRCTRPVGSVDDPTYFDVQVYEVRPDGCNDLVIRITN